MSDKDENSYLFTQYNPETDQTETVDIRTGQVVSLQEKFTPFEELKKSDCIEYECADGTKMLIQRGISQDNLPSRIKFKYSSVFRDLFCQKLIEGQTLTKIAEDPQMPSLGHLYKLRAEYSDFKTAWDDARKMQANTKHDEAVDLFGDIEKGGELNKVRAKADVLRWSASVLDPEQYGNRTKITGDKDNPVGFIIQTFISKDPLSEEDLPPEDKKDIMESKDSEKPNLTLIDKSTPGEKNGKDS